MRSIRFLLIVSFISIADLLPQVREISLSGFITDARSGGELIGVTVLIYKDSVTANPLSGTTSNTSGYYKLAGLPPAEYILVCRMVGYESSITAVPLSSNKKMVILNARLNPVDYKLREVIIEGKKLDKSSISTIDLPPRMLAALPTMSGQTDIYKILELLPGITKGSDISSGMYVRGSSPDQTLTLVDGVQYYHPAHLGNIASAFNADIIKDMRLVKGAFPAEYGGRLSSVLDIKLRPGTKEREKGVLGLGLVNSFFVFEGPLNEHSSYIVSGRSLYYDQIQEKFYKGSSAPRYTFYDLNLKYNNTISESDAISLCAGFNSDRAYSPAGGESEYEINWKNTFVSLNWLKITPGSVFLNSNFSIVNYSFSSMIGTGSSSAGSTSYYSHPVLTDYILKENAEFSWREHQKFKTGFELTAHRYQLRYSDYYVPAIESDPGAGKDLTLSEASLFAQYEAQLLPEVSINAGGRVFYFGGLKMLRFEPRFSTSLQIADDVFLKAAAALSHQFLHLITRNDVALPTDLWYPSTKTIEPSNAVQFVLGLDSYFGEGMYQASVEGYYKEMNNLYELKSSARLDALDADVERQFTRGKGEAYGVELFFNKRTGKLNGWIGYTLAWTKRKFTELNFSETYYPKYDRRHDVAVVLSLALNKNIDIGVTWNYASGERYTLPNGQFAFTNPALGTTPQLHITYPPVNASRFPDFHKLDINVSYRFDWRGKEIQSYINLYNVYNRQNPFAQYVVFEKDAAGELNAKIKRLTLFPFIPSFGIRIKF